MGRYLGPRTCIDRRFRGQIFGNSKYYQKKPVIKRKLKRRVYKSEYSELLNSKMKILYMYNIRENQLHNYVIKATKKRACTDDLLITMLEMRLDNVIYRIGFGKTRKACRQLVSHKHICVNNNVVNIASYQVKVGDVISYSPNAKNNKNIVRNMSGDCVNVFRWINIDNEKKIGNIISMPMKSDISEKINLDLKGVIEFYSR